MKNKKNIQGFTLLELFSVVVIIAVLAAISVPNFLEAQIRSKTSKAKVDMAVISAGLQNYKLEYGVYPAAKAKLSEYDIAVYSDNNQRNWGNNYAQTSAPADEVSTESLQTQRPGFAEPGMMPAVPGMMPVQGGMLGAPPVSNQNNAAAISDRKTSESLIKNKMLYSPYDLTALNALTTPVAYCPNSVFVDPFDSNLSSTWSIPNNYGARLRYKYYNLCQINRDGVDIPEMGKNLGFRIFSAGPDTSVNLFPMPPISKPLFYDPTNGTVSHGDLYCFER